MHMVWEMCAEVGKALKKDRLVGRSVLGGLMHLATPAAVILLPLFLHHSLTPDTRSMAAWQGTRNASSSNEAAPRYKDTYSHSNTTLMFGLLPLEIINCLSATSIISVLLITFKQLFKTSSSICLWNISNLSVYYNSYRPVWNVDKIFSSKYWVLLSLSSSWPKLQAMLIIHLHLVITLILGGGRWAMHQSTGENGIYSKHIMPGHKIFICKKIYTAKYF